MQLFQKTRRPTFEEIKREIEWIASGISYKPGSSFELRWGYMSLEIFLNSRIYADAVTGKEFEGQLRSSRYFSNIECFLINNVVNKDAVIQAMFLVCKDAEEHERDEWFRVDGDAIYNPHRRT